MRVAAHADGASIGAHRFDAGEAPNDRAPRALDASPQREHDPNAAAREKGDGRSDQGFGGTYSALGRRCVGRGKSTGSSEVSKD